MRKLWRATKRMGLGGRRARVRSAGASSLFEVLEVRAVLAGDASTPLFPMADVGEVMPDFQLVDDNPTSSTLGDSFSPRDYLEQVSGWYFIHTT